MSERTKQMIPEVSQVYCKVLGVLGFVSVDWSWLLAWVSKVQFPSAMGAVEWGLKIAILIYTLLWTRARFQNERRNKNEKS